MTTLLFAFVALLAAFIAAPAFAAPGQSSIQSNFNGTPIAGGSYIWFTSVCKVNGVGATPVTIQVINQTITFTVNGTPYTLSVPNTTLTVSSTNKTAATSFSGGWNTNAGSNLSGNLFLGALAFQVPAGGFPGGINPVTWTGSFISSQPGVTVNWQWEAAVYNSSFGSLGYNGLNVKPTDDNQASVYKNSDDAGTPEGAKKLGPLGGARGGAGSNYTGSHSATGTVTPTVQTAAITGSVACTVCGCAVPGATVELLNGSNIVATTTTDSTGSFTFSNEATGTYSIDVVDNPDYQPFIGSSFSFNSSGSNVNEAIGLSPTPISYESNAGQALGQVYFATAAVWQGAGFSLGSTTIGPSDLSTNNFVSDTTVYPYSGPLPNYPELGSFSGNIYALVLEPLVNANVWNNSSFVNLVGLFDVWPASGGGNVGTSNDFTIRTLFDQPFTGPGTAYNYAISGLSFTTPTPAPPSSVTSNAALWVGGGTIPPTPPGGTYPAGWMAQSQVQFTVPASTEFTFFINGSYNDICGEPFSFSICPNGSTPF
jgi:hypothetical protein